MKLGMIGLGRMGANMAQRLLRGGHQVVGFDPQSAARKALEDKGAASADSLQALVAALPAPRTLWLMVPAGDITDASLDALLPLLSAGDTVVDGGNAFYKDTLRRAARFAEHGIAYVDCGTSGGVWGLEEGYSLMVGGDDAVVARLRPVVETLAPAKDQGWGHVGPVGAGHFTKMVHNGIEYGMMQAYAEGFAILRHKADFALDLQQVADVWRHGSVVRSWLLAPYVAAAAVFMFVILAAGDITSGNRLDFGPATVTGVVLLVLAGVGGVLGYVWAPEPEEESDWEAERDAKKAAEQAAEQAAETEV